MPESVVAGTGESRRAGGEARPFPGWGGSEEQELKRRGSRESKAHPSDLVEGEVSVRAGTGQLVAVAAHTRWGVLHGLGLGPRMTGVWVPEAKMIAVSGTVAEIVAGAAASAAAVLARTDIRMVAARLGAEGVRAAWNSDYLPGEAPGRMHGEGETERSHIATESAGSVVPGLAGGMGAALH